MRTLCLALAAAFLFPAAPIAQTTLRGTITGQLDAVMAAQKEAGFTPDDRPLGRATMLGLLENRSSVLLELTLEQGREYLIAAGCDTDCDNLDTSLLRPGTFALLVEDVDPDDVPVINITPMQAGVHLIAVMMASCKTGLCYWGFVVLSRPAPPAPVVTPAR